MRTGLSDADQIERGERWPSWQRSVCWLPGIQQNSGASFFETSFLMVRMHSKEEIKTMCTSGEIPPQHELNIVFRGRPHILSLYLSETFIRGAKADEEQSCGHI